MEFQTKYRVLKTSWGIAIDLGGILEESNSGNNILIVSESTITADEKEQIISGLNSILTTALTTKKKYKVDINKIWFNYTDFQLDGLYWASRDWLTKALNINVKEPEISYDKSSNKYNFRLNS